MLRYVTLILAVAVGALALATAASAHAGGWYWSLAKAETYVDGALTVDDDIGLVEAECAGVGARWRGKYHHFRCAARDDLDRVWSFTLHPTSARAAVLTNVRCDDSESDYYCD